MRQTDFFRLLTSDKVPSKVLWHTNQRDTPYCIYFALKWMLAWNTWDILPDEKVIELGNKYKPWKLHARMPELIKLLSPFYNCYTIREDWTTILKKWWGIQVYARPTKQFWIDVSDGKLDVETLPWDWLDHSFWIHEVDGKILVENSWENLQTFDITGKLETLRTTGLIPWAGYCFTKK